MKKYQNTFAFVIYSALFVYVVLRASLLSFTHDESLTYRLINGDFQLRNTANHHVLNTWLMQISAFFFGNSEISLRLPNVLAFLILVFYIQKLLNLIKLRSGFFILLPLILFNPFILDFFSLARGYGLSLALMMAGIFYFLKFNSIAGEGNKLKYFVLALVFSSLSLCANLALINFYIAVLLISLLCFFLTPDFLKLKKWHFTAVCFAGLIPLVIGINRLLFLKEGSELYFGTEDFDYALDSLFERSSYFSNYHPSLGNILKHAAIYLLPTGLLLALTRWQPQKPLFLITILLSVNLTGLFLEHYIFAALYPVGRTGIYLWPLFALFLNLFVEELLNFLPAKLSKGISFAFSIIVFTALFIHLAFSFNFRYFFEWRYDQHTKHVAEVLVKKQFNTPAKPVAAVTWLFEPTMQYYIHSRKMNLEVTKWNSAVNAEAVYCLDVEAPGKGWQKDESFPDVEAALYYRADTVSKIR